MKVTIEMDDAEFLPFKQKYWEVARFSKNYAAALNVASSLLYANIESQFMSAFADLDQRFKEEAVRGQFLEDQSG